MKSFNKNKRSIVILIVLLLIGWYSYAQVSSINNSSSSSSIENKNLTITTGEFNDIAWHKYRSSIEYIQSLWIVKWYPDGSYGPDRSITRAEMMKIVLLSSLWNNSFLWDTIWNQASCFSDVKKEWFAKYVCYWKEKGIIKGYPNWNFGPNNDVTLAEWLKITLKTYKAPIKEWTWNWWYLPYVEFAHNNNIFSKYALYPDSPMSRGQMAYLIHQLLLEKNNKIVFTNERNNKSAWCGNKPPSKVPSSSIVNWITRNYITVVGNKYDKDTPTKLIFAFHWRTNSNKQVQWYYKIDKASQWNAIIVYPLWLPESWPSRSWNTDFKIFDTLVEEFTDNYCINQDEIYVMGHSLWAWYTNSLACARGDVIRATWSVWWWITYNECTWPVASLIMHNPDDRLASFSSWLNARDQILKRNQCREETRPVWPSRWNCVEYIWCINDSTVIRCPHSDSTAYNWNYYPHTRPDNAWQEIRKFFNTHSW